MSRLRLAALVVLALVLGACTGTAAGGSSPTPGGSTDVVVPPGTGVYLYANAGLTATLELKGSAGTLKIVNETGRALPKPDFYVLDARDGKRFEGTIEASAPVENGATATFDVSIAASADPKQIGLVVLLMGSDNYGAFVLQ